MRQYRGRRKDNGEWVVGALIPLHNIQMCGGGMELMGPAIARQESQFEPMCHYDVEPDSVGQDTGETDKNGNPIFEGQRVTAPGGQKGIIKFGCYAEDNVYPLGYYIEWDKEQGYRKSLPHWAAHLEVEE